jgi:LysM repeat protein
LPLGTRTGRRILSGVERICPLLALEDDAHTVVDGFDAAHRCHASRHGQPIKRAYQVSTCLQAAHTSCPLFMEAMRARSPLDSPSPAAADARLLSTRLILTPDYARGRLVPNPAASARRWAVGVALATIGALAVASGVTGALGSLDVPPAGESVADARRSDSPLVLSASSGPATATPTPSASSPTRAAQPTSSPRPTPEPTPRSTPRPEQQRTYVVRPGDTLNAIAARFGITAVAIQQANGLGSSDVIVIGQELVIP